MESTGFVCGHIPLVLTALGWLPGNGGEGGTHSPSWGWGDMGGGEGRKEKREEDVDWSG